MTDLTPVAALARVQARVERAGGPDNASLLLLAEQRVCARLVIGKAVVAALRSDGPLTTTELAALPAVAAATTIDDVTLTDVLDQLAAHEDITAAGADTWRAGR